MTLEKLKEEIKVAMLKKKETGDGLKCTVLKNVLEKAQKAAKEIRQEDNITESMIVDAAKKELKQLQDTLQYCKEGTGKFNETTKSIAIVQEFLPVAASVEDMTNYLNVEKDNIKNIGDAMKGLKQKFGDSLDGALASKTAKEWFNNK